MQNALLAAVPPPVVVSYSARIQNWCKMLSWLPCLLLWWFPTQLVFKTKCSPGCFTSPVVFICTFSFKTDARCWLGCAALGWNEDRRLLEDRCVNQRLHTQSVARLPLRSPVRFLAGTVTLSNRLTVSVFLAVGSSLCSFPAFLEELCATLGVLRANDRTLHDRVSGSGYTTTNTNNVTFDRIISNGNTNILTPIATRIQIAVQ